MKSGGKKMYKCKRCKKQSKKGDTLFKIYQYKILEKGFDIVSEENVCCSCYNKNKEKKSNEKKK